MCPNCDRVVYRVDGCASMTCGRDASDKGGGNAQDGCGKFFNWSTAKPYVSRGQNAHKPQIMANADLQRVQGAEHFMADQDTRLKCMLCKQDIHGPRFSCVNCPGKGLELCLDCSNKDEIYYVSEFHKSDHQFKIHLEDSCLDEDFPE